MLLEESSICSFGPPLAIARFGGMDTQQTRHQNLLKLLQEYGSQKTFAEAADLSDRHVSQMVNKHRGVGERIARKIEDKLALPKHWMDTDHSEGAADVIGHYNVGEAPPLQGKVPEISWVQAGHAQEAVDLYHPGEGREWVETTVQVRRHTYALRVEGDSMMPRFPPGIRIVVEPEMDAEANDFVIAKDGDGAVTFKQLVQDGGDWYLKPLNERYPIKPLDGWVVIGVVREAVERFR